MNFRGEDWCAEHGILELAAVKTVHIAAFIKDLQDKDCEPSPLSTPTVKQHLAAPRMLFDSLVTGQVIATNPAHSVRGPKYVVKTGKTPVLASEEARALRNSIDTSTLIGLRGRALIATMTYTLARVTAVLGVKVRDYYVQGRRYRSRIGPRRTSSPSSRAGVPERSRVVSSIKSLSASHSSASPIGAWQIIKRSPRPS